MHGRTTENALIDAERAQKRCNAAGVWFVNLALDTGLMFYRTASLSESEDDARRSEAKAPQFLSNSRPPCDGAAFHS
jgi:hypothetical protein